MAPPNTLKGGHDVPITVEAGNSAPTWTFLEEQGSGFKAPLTVISPHLHEDKDRQEASAHPEIVKKRKMNLPVKSGVH